MWSDGIEMRALSKNICVILSIHNDSACVRMNGG